jgi:hypothetical protein
MQAQVLRDYTGAIRGADCPIQQRSMSTCALVDAQLLRCSDSSISCSNTATSVHDCGTDATVAAVKEALAKNPAATAVVDANLAKAGFRAGDIEGYIQWRCQGAQTAFQSALVPRLTLQNCTEVSVQVWNELSQAAVCGAGALQELVNETPPKLTPLPSAQPTPLTYVLVGCGALLAVMIIITIAVIVVRQRAPKPGPPKTAG